MAERLGRKQLSNLVSPPPSSVHLDNPSILQWPGREWRLRADVTLTYEVLVLRAPYFVIRISRGSMANLPCEERYADSAK